MPSALKGNVIPSFGQILPIVNANSAGAFFPWLRFLFIYAVLRRFVLVLQVVESLVPSNLALVAVVQCTILSQGNKTRIALQACENFTVDYTFK